MTSTRARAPKGVSTGGQFVQTQKSAPALESLAGTEAAPNIGDVLPPFPSQADLAARWPNRRQRLDRFNEELYAHASHPFCPIPDRLGAARRAVADTLEVKGEFASLSHDDEANNLVEVALRDEAMVLAAIREVGDLDQHEASTFGDRLAGALYDAQVRRRDGVEEPASDDFYW